MREEQGNAETVKTMWIFVMRFIGNRFGTHIGALSKCGFSIARMRELLNQCETSTV